MCKVSYPEIKDTYDYTTTAQKQLPFRIQAALSAYTWAGNNEETWTRECCQASRPGQIVPLVRRLCPVD